MWLFLLDKMKNSSHIYDGHKLLMMVICPYNDSTVNGYSVYYLHKHRIICISFFLCSFFVQIMLSVGC
jgi:hypothetical protein